MAHDTVIPGLLHRWGVGSVAQKKLKVYRTKRDFTKTSELSGKAAVATSKVRRFVIQKHDATRLHYDLRLEYGGIFKSWAVTRGPSSIGRTRANLPSSLH